MSGDKRIKVGSRKSELALIQTNHVISLLKEYHPHKEFEIVTMTTMGDQILDKPLPKIGEKSLFTKELETALSVGCVDFVVHSLKDLPTTLPQGMAIGAVLTREDPRDSLILRKNMQNYDLTSLPANSTIGTSSLRRAAQLSKKYPHIKVENIRGNLNTRLKKLDELDKFHAIVLATAGLHRMGWHNRISKILETDELLYAVGQGALAVECREKDVEIIALLKPLYDVETALTILAERSFLKTLGGGCSAPVAVVSKLVDAAIDKKEIQLKGAVWSLDGKEEILESDKVTIEVTLATKCAKCPLSKTAGNTATCCANKRSSDSDDNKDTKKLKTDLPAEILKDDPHEHCPVDLPIGVDFMGKCPYLEQCQSRKCPVNGHIEGDGFDKGECPFMKEYTSSTNGNTTESKKNESELYVGLVPHPDIPKSVMDDALKLGINLANKLISKGALEVMEKAKTSIHNS